ncbi:MAG: hypothetical protein IPO64_04105 [Bacteroidetes bacterium]|nr:hypothetical protein [Bacteroidota bacterium]
MNIRHNLIALTLLMFFMDAIIRIVKNKRIRFEGKRIVAKGNELLLKEKVLNVKKAEAIKKSISIIEAVQLAENQFQIYLANFLKTNDATLELQESRIGDFTGDGIDDIVIDFCISPSGNGNTNWPFLKLYQNTGTQVKFIADYNPSYLFSFDKISNGKIYVKKLEFSEDDARCCPSIEKAHTLNISGSKAY